MGINDFSVFSLTIATIQIKELHLLIEKKTLSTKPN
jgi:hypothetical protein